MANSQPRRNLTPQRQYKPAKRGTPIRNSLLLLIMLGVLAVLVVALPKTPDGGAVVLAPGAEENGEATVSLASVLRISEVMSSNKTAIPDDKGTYPDWVEITNTGETPVNIGGVGLSDRENRIVFLFPQMELPAGGYVVVFCDGTDQSETGRAFHARFNISSLGEGIFLFDPNTHIIDSVQVPPMNGDISYAKIDGKWELTELNTPGYPNTQEAYAQMRQSTVASANGLVINEIQASNVSTIADEDGDYSDWIEIYNGGALPVDLSNYALSDDLTKLVKWRFPKGAVIGPGEYYLVFASKKDRPGGGDLFPHTNFGLAAERETVVLCDVYGQIIDQVSYENLAKDTSWGRVPGLEYAFQVYQSPTPKLSNTRASEIEMDRRMRAGNYTGVFLSEVVTSTTGLETPFGKTSYDWIEVANLSGNTVNLKGWGLSDRVGHPRRWQFPDVDIGPGEYLLVFTSGLLESPSRSGALHADFRLSVAGETIVLSDPNGVIVDKLVVPKLELNNSYGRSFDHGGLFYYEQPTPGEANYTVGFEGYAPAPAIEKKGALLTRPITTEISAPEGVRIRYTLDGSRPTETNGMDYTGPIEIKKAAVLRARGFVQGLKPSEIVTESYLINAYHVLPVVSLTIDPDDLWNPTTGIYTLGIELTPESTLQAFQNAVYRLVKKDRTLRERAGNFEYFTPEGEQLLNQGTAVQLHGQFSLDLAQKSFRISAKTRYGNTTIPLAFFPDRPFTEYQAVILRNGGNDGAYTRLVDALCSKMVDWTDSEIMHMASTPVIVYVNGEYWGHYDIRERFNTDAVAAYEGLPDPDAVDFIKGDNNVLNGSYKNYGELINYVKEHDLNDLECLRTVLDWIDVDNYFDFMIFEMFFGNTDTLNIKFYRPNTPGAKWKWILFDLDWGYFDRKKDGCYIWLKPQGAGEKRAQNVLIRKLLEVPEMQDKFLRRYGEIFQIFADTDRVLALIDEMQAAIEPEMGLHFNRWAGETSKIVAFDPPSDPEAALNFWVRRINRMKNIVRGRPYHVWGHVQDWFKLSDAQMEAYFGPRPAETEDIY